MGYLTFIFFLKKYCNNPSFFSFLLTSANSMHSVLNLVQARTDLNGNNFLI